MGWLMKLVGDEEFGKHPKQPWATIVLGSAFAPAQHPILERAFSPSMFASMRNSENEVYMESGMITGLQKCEKAEIIGLYHGLIGIYWGCYVAATEADAPREVKGLELYYFERILTHTLDAYEYVKGSPATATDEGFLNGCKGGLERIVDMYDKFVAGRIKGTPLEADYEAKIKKARAVCNS